MSCSSIYIPIISFFEEKGSTNISLQTNPYEFEVTASDFNKSYEETLDNYLAPFLKKSRDEECCHNNDRYKNTISFTKEYIEVMGGQESDYNLFIYKQCPFYKSMGDDSIFYKKKFYIGRSLSPHLVSIEVKYILAKEIQK